MLPDQDSMSTRSRLEFLVISLKQGGENHFCQRLTGVDGFHLSYNPVEAYLSVDNIVPV